MASGEEEAWQTFLHPVFFLLHAHLSRMNIVDLSLGKPLSLLDLQVQFSICQTRTTLDCEAQMNLGMCTHTAKHGIKNCLCSSNTLSTFILVCIEHYVIVICIHVCLTT